MTVSLYNAGLETFSAWTTATFRWLLLQGGTVDIDLTTVAAVVAASTGEVSVVSYARVNAVTPTRVVDNTLNRISYHVANPAFAGMSGGQTAKALLLYRFGTTDGDSTPVAWWDINPPTGVATNAASPLEFTVPSGIVAYIDQGA